MGIFILAVLIGLIPAAIAKGKGRSFGLWWFYGAALFIIALPHALIMKADTKSLETTAIADGGKKCPHCAEVVKQEATVCRFCHKSLEPEKSLVRPVSAWQPYCPSCKFILDKGATECPSCGHMFAAVNSTKATVAATVTTVENIPETKGINVDIAGQIVQLSELKKQGILSEEEFNAAKAKLLS